MAKIVNVLRDENLLYGGPLIDRGAEKRLKVNGKPTRIHYRYSAISSSKKAVILSNGNIVNKYGSGIIGLSGTVEGDSYNPPDNVENERLEPK